MADGFMTASHSNSPLISWVKTCVQDTTHDVGSYLLQVLYGSDDRCPPGLTCFGDRQHAPQFTEMIPNPMVSGENKLIRLVSPEPKN